MWYVLVLTTVAFFSSSFSLAQGNFNFSALKSDTEVFERVVEERIRQGFTTPYASGEAEAAYLQGYGIVISFHLNINRSKIRTPFMDVQAPKEVAMREREEQLKRAREIMIQCLAEHSGSIKQLSAHDRISISAHIEDRSELDTLKKETILVVTSTKDDVDLLNMRKITADEFRQRVHILSY